MLELVRMGSSRHSADSAVFDYIVIGAGTAGCLLANRLSSDPSKRVLAIEAGGPDRYHWIHIPVGYLYCIGNPRTDWLYFTEQEAGLNGRRLRYPRGKVLGGCSSINGMIYMRGQARDYDHWAELTRDDAWRWRECLPYFMRHEDHYRATDSNGIRSSDVSVTDYHGAGGEWRIERQRLRWEILEAFAEAAVQAGIARCDDFNRGNNAGVGYFEVNQRSGWRWNTARAFLRPIQHRRDNFELWTGAHVTRLAFERDDDGALRCVGARVATGAGWRDVRARREVVLAAGAIGTPHLLQLSGIGPAALLQQHGVPVHIDLPGVGENLQDHLQIRAVFTVRGVKTLNTLSASWWGKLRIGIEYALRRSGPMSMAPSQLGAFARSDPSLSYPNLEYHVQPLSLDAFGEPLHTFDAFTASVCNLNPTSRGFVRLTSARSEDAPAIAPNYLSTPEDQLLAARSLRLTRHIVSQPALDRYQPREFRPGVQYQSDDDLARLAGDIATTIFHPVGTCKMGPADDPKAVLSSRLCVRGVRSLRVADASVMPTITSGNTNSPVLMIAEKAAHWVCEDNGHPLAAARSPS
jgi:choline dehydrogenase